MLNLGIINLVQFNEQKYWNYSLMTILLISSIIIPLLLNLKLRIKKNEEIINIV